MASYNQVSYGSTDKESVKQLQNLLNSTGNYNLATDGIFGAKTKQAVMDYQKANGLAVDGIVGKNTWAALTKTSSNATQNTPTSTSTPGNTGNSSASSSTGFQHNAYKPSDVVTQAEALLQQQLANKPSEYQSAWQTQLSETLDKILNREKFSYDLNGDALYQQYKDQYTTQGKLAMMDTMGQAQAMTGGYGNSYAQSVGQQAYQGYLQQLNDRVPELYQLALNQYNREGDELFNQASIMAQMEEQDYGRYRDSMADYYTELDRLAEDARYQGEMDYSKWADNRDFSYGQYVDDRNLAYQQDRDKVADQQWQAQFDEAKRQFDKQYNLSASKSSSSGGTKSSGDYTATSSNYTQNPGLTKSEILSIQKQAGIDEDGIWGPDTAKAYDSGIRPQDTTNYYTKILNDLIAGKSSGKDNAWANQYLSAMVDAGVITQSSQMTLYNKFRDNRL